MSVDRKVPFSFSQLERGAQAWFLTTVIPPPLLFASLPSEIDHVPVRQVVDFAGR